MDPDEKDPFTTLSRLRALARADSETAFGSACRAPGLLLGVSEQRLDAPNVPKPEEGGMLTLNRRSMDFLRYLDKVAFLIKRPGNPFPRIISLGRTAVNDVPIDVRSVSKLHGHFERDQTRWCYSDNQSTSGSWLNGRRLEPNKAYPLENGDRLRIGPDLEAEFLSPEALYERARSS